MDVNTLRAVTTVVMFVAFLGIVWFALRRQNRSGFDEAARLPFADDRPPTGRQPAPKE